MQIYFLQFHVKINRIVKSYPDVAGYSSFIIQDFGPFDATNFPYNDGISTRETYNFETEKMPDYAIIADDEGVVRSRWYVDETKWKCRGQWIVSFRRDVLADFYDQVINANAFIEKATVGYNDPAIYNEEPVSFNSIKSSEKLLKDKSGSAWIVGYLSTDNASEKTYNAITKNQIRRYVAGISNFEYYKYQTEDFVGAPISLAYNVKVTGQQNGAIGLVAFDSNGATLADCRSSWIGGGILYEGDYAFDEFQKDGGTVPFKLTYGGILGGPDILPLSSKIGEILPLHRGIDDIFINQDDTIHSAVEEGAFKAYDGLLIYDTVSNKTYMVTVTKRDLAETTRYLPNSFSALYEEVTHIMEDTGMVSYNSIYSMSNINKDIYVKYTANHYRISLTEVKEYDISASITASRNILNDAPYSMFAIPYHAIDYKIGADTYTSDPDSSLAIAKQISIELMSSKALYDLQLLPYCPRPDLIKDGYIDLRSSIATEHQDYEIVVDRDSNNRSFIIFALQSSFTFDIEESIEVTEKKVQNQCDSWRLCSPNYNGVFEFNAVKNDGVDYFNVDCTYRPYNPYIHVNPNFKGLYGNDYDDARGLICAGDFSMPASTDKWMEYEAQNKNYQNSFDRSIQHMEINQKYERTNQIISSVLGAGSGAIGGAMISGGNPVGAVAGGLLSAAGGIADYFLKEDVRKEEIKYAKDQFNFSLENIRALPNSLARVSAFNKNNKIFPFLEYYTCTDTERDSFRAILEFDGMTVKRIGKIADFLLPERLNFIRARILRFNDIHDDRHIIDFLASEVEKGAYYDTRSD